LDSLELTAILINMTILIINNSPSLAFLALISHRREG